MFGTLKNVAVPVSCLEKAMDDRSAIDLASLNGFAKEEETELYLKPDFSTFTILPWRPQNGKVARFLCDVCTEDEREYELSPRLILKRALQDPGNLGTIFRTAEAAGVTGIIMSRDCVDIYNPKTIRSTMGALYRMPFVYVEDLRETIHTLKEKNIKSYAAHLDGKNTYDKEDYRQGTAFLIGNEGNGLREEIAQCADTWIRIPMCGQVESLNAAVAATVLMFEVSRQRRG